MVKGKGEWSSIKGKLAISIPDANLLVVRMNSHKSAVDSKALKFQ